jgi:hypothetical protein
MHKGQLLDKGVWPIDCVQARCSLSRTIRSTHPRTTSTVISPARSAASNQVSRLKVLREQRGARHDRIRGGMDADYVQEGGGGTWMGAKGAQMELESRIVVKRTPH